MTKKPLIRRVSITKKFVNAEITPTICGKGMDKMAQTISKEKPKRAKKGWHWIPVNELGDGCENCGRYIPFGKNKLENITHGNVVCSDKCRSESYYLLD